MTYAQEDIGISVVHKIPSEYASLVRNQFLFCNMHCIEFSKITSFNGSLVN